MSARRKTTSARAERMSAAAASPFSALRPEMISRVQPSASKVSAMARPSPCAPPVIDRHGRGVIRHAVLRHVRSVGGWRYEHSRSRRASSGSGNGGGLHGGTNISLGDSRRDGRFGIYIPICAIFNLEIPSGKPLAAIPARAAFARAVPKAGARQSQGWPAGSPVSRPERWPRPSRFKGIGRVHHEAHHRPGCSGSGNQGHQSGGRPHHDRAQRKAGKDTPARGTQHLEHRRLIYPRPFAGGRRSDQHDKAGDQGGHGGHSGGLWRSRSVPRSRGQSRP